METLSTQRHNQPTDNLFIDNKQTKRKNSNKNTNKTHKHQKIGISLVAKLLQTYSLSRERVDVDSGEIAEFSLNFAVDPRR